MVKLPPNNSAEPDGVGTVMYESGVGFVLNAWSNCAFTKPTAASATIDNNILLALSVVEMFIIFCFRLSSLRVKWNVTKQSLLMIRLLRYSCLISRNDVVIIILSFSKILQLLLF